MRPWTWVRRILALVVTVVFALSLFTEPAMARKSFGGSRGFRSAPRSFSKPRTTAPKTTSPSRSFSSPKATSPSTKPSTTQPRSFSTPAPPKTSTDSKGYTSPDSKGFSSGSRSFSSPGGSFSNERPSTTAPGGSSTTAPKVTTPPPVVYDRGRTKYPSLPPVVVLGPTVYEPTYYHDYYWGRPWYWRMWHRPHYSATGGWGISWVSVIVGLVLLWILLGVLSSIMARRRRNR